MKHMLNTVLAAWHFLVRTAWKVWQAAVGLLGPAPGWTGIKRWLKQIAALGVLVGTSGFLIASLGLIPIKASSGHWPITAWLLHFTMVRSVSTHTVGIEVPTLDEPGMVLKGATHYQSGCFPCHGNPSIQQPRVARHMTPHPPYLPPIINQWEPEELFYIVKHGVKFTGMPAWPASHRDDEVWAIVAFLKKFPELNEDKYRQMVSDSGFTNDIRSPIQGLSGRADSAKPLSVSCDSCHGMDGQGRGPGVAPKLAGQKFEYLEASLTAFSQGKRHSGIMAPVAAGLSTHEIREIAKYYSEIESAQPLRSNPTSELAIARGAAIARGGTAKTRTPICAKCHEPGDGPRNAVYPNLAGQYADYLKLQLELFAKGHRGGTEFKALMHPVVATLTTEQMHDVAIFYESLTVSQVP